MIELFTYLMRKEMATAKEIAEQFECSTRTAYRRVDKLSTYVPIVTIRGRPAGGIYITAEYKKEFLKSIEKQIL